MAFDTVIAKSVATSITGAKYADGATLAGTWTANYNSTGGLVSVTSATFTVSGPGGSNTFNNMGTLPYAQDPTSSGFTSYEIHNLSSSGQGTYNSLYVDWRSEAPTSFYEGSPSLYTSITNSSVSSTAPIRLTSDGTSGTGSSPVITGLAATQSGTDAATASPFSNVTVTDSNSTISATIILNGNGSATDADGVLSGTGLTKIATGTYSLAFTSPSSLTAELNALKFTPTAHQVAPGSQVGTAINLSINDSGGSTSATSTLTETAQYTAPTISGVPASQSGTDSTSVAVFGSTTVTDPDNGAAPSATITLTANGTATDADGVLSGTGLTRTGVGTYTLAAASPATLTSELDALSFKPTAHQVAAGSTVTTVFTLLASEGSTSSSATSSVAVTAACYCPSTLILTDAGEVAVEALRVGDRVVTHVGVARPIRWIGHRRYDARLAAGRRTLWPVLIRAGALADGVPRRDLRVSPLHAMWLDGALIPAVALVNGVSILQPPVTEAVAYVHVELDTHDLILAEGAASESFVDDRSRAMFDNAASYRALYPDARPQPARYCAPRVEDGALLQAARRRISARIQPTVLAPELRGRLDRVCRDRVEGWARDDDDLAGATLLRLSDNGVTIAEMRADRYRDDLDRAGIGAGRHGFWWRVPGGLSPDLRHTIRIERAADGRELGGSPWVLEAVAAPGHAV